MLMRSGQPSSMNPVYGETVEGGREKERQSEFGWNPRKHEIKSNKVYA